MRMRPEDFGQPSEKMHQAELLALLCQNYDSVLDLTLKFIEDSVNLGRDPIETVNRARYFVNKARETMNTWGV